MSVFKSEGQWPRESYQLLDFGSGRKLERLGGQLLDRPCPAAEGFQRNGQVDWSKADLRLDRRGKPIGPGPRELPVWEARYQDIEFGLKLTPFGHVGLFPEQHVNWQWLTQQAPLPYSRPLRALNLFGYTGGTTLALAAHGIEVVHVDASSPAVAWARRNAEASQLQERPIRWIVEDARKFVRRELKRGNRYDIVVMDPPSFGHGPSGVRWDMQSHLPALLADCLQLLATETARLLVTGHSEKPDEWDIQSWIDEDLQAMASGLALDLSVGRLGLTDLAGRVLDAGYFVRGIAP
ncbi:class I SAM-dependent methyltransferase [Aureliella helgolandensis]|uniref:Ribosomal RNA large subunit methyltransferase I n=1 Tax=Aureliella helgolandensis TaxID=2527968 RepID=A0A518GC63_9BACT|nr:class I SAM-dependent methyltransferase [Aureliella helgolandensis]QDV26181.1 Ribosomal RNA large subunit methyltransferase I [Aureliella helgolandensis]